MRFEESVVRSFLQALGWSEYDGNLEEQESVYHGKDRSDFFLHTQYNTKDRLIIIDLKRPEHKQRSKDIEQLERYLKTYGCRFGIYLGEKLEVFYRKPKGDDFVAVSVTTIDYTPNNPAAEQLLRLIKFDSFDKDKLDKYCLDNLEMDEFVKNHQTQEGQQELYDAIIEKCNLSPAVISKLKSVLTFNIGRSQTTEKNELPISSDISNKGDSMSNVKDEGDISDDDKLANIDSLKLIEDFRIFSLKSVSERTAKKYITNLNNKVRRFIYEIVSPNADSIYSFCSAGEVRNCISKLKVSKDFMEADEKSSGYLLAALNKYLQFIETRNSNQISSDSTEPKNVSKIKKRGDTQTIEPTAYKVAKDEKTERQTVKKNGRRPPFKFHMIGLKPGDTVTFYPTGVNVKVNGDDTVEYQGKTWQLSPFCQNYYPTEGSESQQFRGPSYFKYKGKTLARIRDEKEGYVKSKKNYNKKKIISL